MDSLMEGCDNLMENKDIKSITNIDNGFIHIEYKEGKGKSLEIPKYIDGEEVPLNDCFKDNTGWFRVNNEILTSNLTQNAKLCYCALRMAVIHSVGFTLLNIAPTQKDDRCLMKFMSVSAHNTVDKALDELEYFGLIKIGHYYYKKVPKNIYIFKPINQWRLPSEDQAKQYDDMLKEAKRKKKEKRDKDKAELEAKRKSGEFVFDKGEYVGLSMSEVFEINPEKVKFYAEESPSDIIKQAAQKVLNDNNYCPEPDNTNTSYVYDDDEEFEEIPI